MPDVPRGRELMKWEYYTPAPSGMGAIFKVHPVYVLQAAYGTADKIPTHIRIIAAMHKEMYDFEVATILMWWAVMPEKIRDHMIDIGMHRIHHYKDTEALAERYEVIRQQGCACQCALGKELFHWLRKAGNLKGRLLGKANVELEKQRLTPGYSMRLMLGAMSGRRRLAYIQSFLRVGGPIVREVVSSVLSKTKHMGMQRWWERRRMHIAAGSSSNRKMLDVLRANDQRIKTMDRPNKRAILEALPSTYLHDIIQTPPFAVARQSTKPEPGRKLRALYAGDDECTFIAAFASYGVETNMNIMGMCPQQKPQDSLRWLQDCMETSGQQVWFSLDFTDFNKDHSSEDLALLNILFSYWWMRMDDSNVGLEKSKCSLWTARSVYNRYVQFDGAPYGVKTFSGLWSGHRDTARDNTLLHKIYQAIVTDWLDRNKPGWGNIIKTHLCGDDEDSLLNDEVAAAYYYTAFQQFGWHLNSAKQCCGRSVHEFLQRTPDDHRLMRAPITSMVCTLCTGQWYKEPGTHQDIAIAACSDQFWEMIVRGAQPEVMHSIGCRILDAYMKIKDFTGQNVKLEWWNYRTKMPVPEQAPNAPHPQAFTKEIHPMWDEGRQMNTRVPPKPFWEDQPTKKLPKRASNDWAQHLRRDFLQYADENTYDRYVTQCAAESYGSLFFHELETRRRQYLLDNWPRRETAYTEVEQAREWTIRLIRIRQQLAMELSQQVRNIICMQELQKMPPTKGEILARNGYDMKAYEMLGGDNNPQLYNKLEVYKTHIGARAPIAYSDRRLLLATPCYDPAVRCLLYTKGL